MANFVARWATSLENRKINNGLENSAVVDLTTRDKHVTCFASPLIMAQRIAYSLNLSAKFSLEELERVSNALTTAERAKS